MDYTETSVLEDEEERSLSAAPESRQPGGPGADPISSFQPGARGIYSTQKAIDWNRDDVVSWLSDVGMGEYASNFHENHISGQTLQDITEKELEDDLDVSNPQHRSLLLIKIRNLDMN